LVVAQEKIEWQQPVEISPHQTRKPIQRKKPRSRWKSVLVLGLTVMIAGALAAETIDLTVVKGAQIREMQQEITAMKANNNLLQVQVDKLRSVSRIEDVAVAMGMEKPAGTVYVAGTLPVAKNQTGAVPTQTAPQQVAEEPSTLKQISQKFTSFFASTQR
jgi:cell division protein FtsL